MDYIHELRKEIGHRKIILNCAGALIIRDGKILFQRRTDNGQWGRGTCDLRHVHG